MEKKRRKKIRVTSKKSTRMLTPASGYLTGYTHTLNPYAGCTYGCLYCYVRCLPVALFQPEEWGAWVQIKENGPQLLARELTRAKKKGPVTLFMSSSTDPYQPVEAKTGLTRRILEVLVEEPPHFLFVQTRSPLITRDTDLLSRLKDRLCISITVETDLEEVRRRLTPAAPPLAARLNALKQLKAAGLAVQAAVSPVLPYSAAFPTRLAQVVDRVCLDDFFRGDGAQGRRTQRLNIADHYEILGNADWYAPEKFNEIVEEFATVFGRERVLISREGFLPFTSPSPPPSTSQ